MTQTASNGKSPVAELCRVYSHHFTAITPMPTLNRCNKVLSKDRIGLFEIIPKTILKYINIKSVKLATVVEGYSKAPFLNSYYSEE